jgi:hypothetical protein
VLKEACSNYIYFYHSASELRTTSYVYVKPYLAHRVFRLRFKVCLSAKGRRGVECDEDVSQTCYNIHSAHQSCAHRLLPGSPGSERRRHGQRESDRVSLDWLFISAMYVSRTRFFFHITPFPPQHTHTHTYT